MTASAPRRRPAGKRLGQHLLRDQAAIEALVGAIQPAAGDRFVELGGGDGALTAHLLRSKAARVDVVELDSYMLAALTKRHARLQRQQSSDAPPLAEFALHRGDMLRLNWAHLAPEPTGSDDGLRLVGNLPYNISSQVLSKALMDTGYWRDAHFLVQTEMGERLAADPESRHWGRLGVLAHLSASAEIVLELAPEVFVPPPAVRSSLLRLRPLRPAPVSPDERDQVLATAALLFGGRRKSLRNSLKKWLHLGDFEELQVDATLRPEALDFASLCRLAQRLRQKQSGQERLGQGKERQEQERQEHANGGSCG